MPLIVIYVLLSAVLGFLGRWKSYLVILVALVALIVGVVLYDTLVVLPDAAQGVGYGGGIALAMAGFTFIAGLLIFLCCFGIGYLVRKTSYSDDTL